MRSHSQVPDRHELGGGGVERGWVETYSTQSPRISSDFGPVSPTLNTPPLTLCSMKDIAFQILQIGKSISQTENESSSLGRNPICPEQLRGRGFLIEWLTLSSAGWSPFIHTCPPQQTTERTYRPSRYTIGGITHTYFTHTNHRVSEKQKNTYVNHTTPATYETTTLKPKALKALQDIFLKCI